MDWYGNRNHEQFIYRKLIWAPDTPQHLTEGETYTNITSGDVELSALSDMKATGQFSYYGDPPENDSLMRVYYSFTDDEGEELEPVCIATLVLAVDEPTYTYDAYEGRLIASGSFTGNSVLSILSDKKLGMPFPVLAGVNPIQYAVQILTGLGLRTNNPNIPETVLTTPHTFESSDTYLTLVNWLMTSATPTHQAVYPDALGNVMVSPYQPPESRTIVETFHDRGGSIMRPNVKEKNDWQNNPNVARFSYSTEQEWLRAVVTLDSGAKWSLDGRGGREKTIEETVTELSGSSVEERLEQLEQAAYNALVANSSEIEHVSLEHGFLPWVRPNVGLAIEYGDRSWNGIVMNTKVSLSPSTQCETEIRRFITSNMQFTRSSEVLWQA